MKKMIKKKMGMMKTSLNQRSLKMRKAKVGRGTPRNTKEPQRTPPTQSYISTTQVTNEWAMSTIEDNTATPRDLSSVQAWMESSKYGVYEKVEMLSTYRWLTRNQRLKMDATTHHVQVKMWHVLNQM